MVLPALKQGREFLFTHILSLANLIIFFYLEIKLTFKMT